MKRNSLTRLITTILIFTLFVGSFIHYSASVSAADTELASFIFSKTAGSATAKDLNDTYGTKADSGYSATGGKFASSSKLFAAVNPSVTSYRKLEWSKANDYSYGSTKLSETPIMAASTKNPWGDAPYILVKTSTTGYEDINFSFRIGASKKGPKSYKVQYSFNGTSYTTIPNSTISLATNKTMYEHSFSVSAASNQQTLYLKIVTADTTTVEGGAFTSDKESGETAINNVVITGVPMRAANTATPKPVVTSKPATSVPTTSPTNNNSITTTTQKTLSAPKLTSYKRGKKVVKGKALKKATVTVTIGSKKYTAKASKKGIFKIKLSSKLKKGRTIKIYATKSGYTQSKTKTYKVK